MKTIKEYIEERLKRLGYSNIKWSIGREGYYCLALLKYGSTHCIGLKDFVDDLMFIEEKGKTE